MSPTVCSILITALVFTAHEPWESMALNIEGHNTISGPLKKLGYCRFNSLRGGGERHSNRSKVFDSAPPPPPEIVGTSDSKLAAEDGPEPYNPEEEERFSYMKVSAREIREAEVKEEKHNKDFEEYVAKQARGEIPDDQEVRDTLRWGDDEKPSKKYRKPQNAVSTGGSRRGASSPRFREAPRAASHGRSLAVDDVELEQGGEDDGEGPMGGLDAGDEAGRGTPDGPEAVREFFKSQGLDQYVETLLNDGWDTMAAVGTMSENDMVDAGIKKGHVRRLVLALGRDPGRAQPPSWSEDGTASQGRRGGSVTRQSLARSSVARSVAREASYARGRSIPVQEDEGDMDGRNRRGDSRWRGREEDEDDGTYRRARSSYAPSQSRGAGAGRRRPDLEEAAGVDTSNNFGRQQKGSGLRTSVKTTFGPGGRSALGEFGGLGAFMYGGDEEEPDNAVPRHRRLQEDKDAIAERLEKSRRRYQDNYGAGAGGDRW